MITLSQDADIAIFQQCQARTLIDLKRTCTMFYTTITETPALIEMVAQANLYCREMTNVQVQKNLLLLFNHMNNKFIVEMGFSLAIAPKEKTSIKKIISFTKSKKASSEKKLLTAVANTLREVNIIHATNSVYVWNPGFKNSWQMPVDALMEKIKISSRYNRDEKIVEFANRIIEEAKKYDPILLEYGDPLDDTDKRWAPPNLLIKDALYDKERWKDS